MPLILEDRIRETTTVTGTNDATLLGAVTGFQAFSVIGNGNTTYYTISDQSGGNWEVGLGTYSSVGPTLARTTVLSSSAGGSKVSFPAGTKDVFVTYPSEKAVYLDGSDNVQPALGNVVASQVNITAQGDLRLEDTSGGQYVALQAPGTVATSYTLTLPVDDGTNGQALITDGSGNLSWSTAASGDVYGPASATDNAISRFDGTTGKIIQNSSALIDDVGNVLAGAGLVGAPAFSTTGDTNTGIFFPAADTIAFTEGGVESMRIDSAGNLGLGTTSPQNYTNYKFITTDGTTGSGLQFRANNTSISEIYVTSSEMFLKAVTSIPMTFATNNTERMRIDSSGNVGINCTATSFGATYRTLEIKGGSGANGGYCLVTSGDGVTTAQLGVDTTTAFIGTRTNHPSVFTTNNAERMRITSVGDLGIGTSSPLGILDARGSAYFGNPAAGTTAFIRGGPNWNFAGLNVIRNAANTANPRSIGMPLDGDDLQSTTIGAYNAIWGAYDSSPTTGSTSSALNGAMVYGAFAGHRWVTNGTERMRIDSSGNLFVGTTTSFPGSGNTAVGLMYENAGTLFSSRATGLALNVNRNSDGAVVSIRRSGTEVGSIGVTTTATNYATSSDYRLKENIAPMTGALAVVSALKPVTYKWKADGSDGQGFIAHELQSVVPDCVIGEKDAVNEDGTPKYQGIDTSFLVATLTKAIQEQQAMIENLTTRLNALEGK